MDCIWLADAAAIRGCSPKENVQSFEVDTWATHGAASLYQTADQRAEAAAQALKTVRYLAPLLAIAKGDTADTVLHSQCKAPGGVWPYAAELVTLG